MNHCQAIQAGDDARLLLVLDRAVIRAMGAYGDARAAGKPCQHLKDTANELLELWLDQLEVTLAQGREQGEQAPFWLNRLTGDQAATAGVVAATSREYQRGRIL